MLAVAAVLAGLFWVLAVSRSGTADELDVVDSPLIGRPAPSLRGTTIDGEPFDLADYRGTPVVLNFWASWCGPCRRELPALAAFAKAHPEIQVIGVDYQDDVEAARTFAAENGATWPSVVDDGPIGAAYEVPGLPATYLIDAQGRIVERLLGEVTEAALTEQLPALMS